MDYNYKNKYLKYKTKYLELKNQLGGTGSNLWHLEPTVVHKVAKGKGKFEIISKIQGTINISVIEFILKWNTLFYIFMYTFDVSTLTRTMFDATGIPKDKLRLFNYWIDNISYFVEYENNAQGVFYIKLDKSNNYPHFSGCGTGTARREQIPDIEWHYTFNSEPLANHNKNTIDITSKQFGIKIVGIIMLINNLKI